MYFFDIFIPARATASAVVALIRGRAGLADCAYSTSARTVYGAVTISTGNVDSGAVKFWVTYRLVA